MKKMIAFFAAALCAPLMLSPVCLCAAAEQSGQPAQAYVFVSDSGNDSADGLTDKTPLKSFSAAVKKLQSNGGRIVLCGKTTLSASSCYVSSCNGLLTVTSLFGTSDYRASGACLVIPSDLFLYGDTAFENVKLTFASGKKICCQGNNVTFGDGTETALSSGNSFPSILGGTDAGRTGANTANCSFYNYTLTVNSGTWNYITGGNYRSDGDHPMGFTGNVRIIINGGTFRATGSSSADSGVISIGTYCGQDGDYYLEINGGSFASSIYGIGRCGANSTRKLASYEGDVTIVITGGSFRTQSISAVQDKKTGWINGDYTLSISGGSFASSLFMLGGAGVNGRAEAFVPADMTQYLSGILPTVYVSSAGSSGADGLSAGTALADIASAAEKLSAGGGVIAVTGTVSVPDGTVIPDCGDAVRITGIGDALLDCGGSISSVSPLIIDNISVKGCTSLCTEGADLTIGENVISDGKTALSCKTGEQSRVLTVLSGKWASADGGSALLGGSTVSVLIGGGEIAETVCGARTRYSLGDVNVTVTGGSIGGNIYAAMAGAANASVCIAGGSIGGAVLPAGNGIIPGCFGISVFGGEISGGVKRSGKVGSVLCNIAVAGAESDFENNTQPAVFVSADGSGDGSSPLSPISDIDAAYAALPADGGYIVVCGRYDITSSFTVKKQGDVTLTSSYCGTDWRRIKDDAALRLGGVYTFAGKTTVDSLSVISLTDTSVFACAGYECVFGEKLECAPYSDRGILKCPSVAGGSYISAGGYGGVAAGNITVNGGTFEDVTGGNIIASGASSSALRIISGDCSVTINGGTFEGAVCASGMNSLIGSASLTVTGGTFDCGVFGIDYALRTLGGAVSVRGNIDISITGGVFCGELGLARRAADASLTGEFTLSLLDGNFARVCSADGGKNVSGSFTSKLVYGSGVNFNGEIAGDITFNNPVADYADPSVFYRDGWYYYTYSETYMGGAGLFMRRAANLCDIGKSEPVMIWAQKVSGTAGEVTSLWAPQLYYIEGKWYLYATCSGSTDEAEARRPYIWVGKTDDPTDGFDYYGTFANLDKTVFSYLSPRLISYGGRLYVVFGGFFRSEDKIAGVKHYQRLFMAELSDPLTMKTACTVISYPTLSWESEGKVSIEEGPFPIVSPGGTLYLAFSAGQTRTDAYCTGVLEFTGSESDSLLDPALWKKHSSVLATSNISGRIFSPGATVFVQSADGSSYYAVYHAKQFSEIGYTLRRLYIQPLTFENDYPVLGNPPAADTDMTWTLNSKPLSGRTWSFGSIESVSYEAPAVTTAAPYDGGEVAPADGDISPAPAGGSFPLWGIIGAAAAAAAAVIALIAGITAKKKKKK